MIDGRRPPAGDALRGRSDCGPACQFDGMPPLFRKASGFRERPAELALLLFEPRGVRLADLFSPVDDTPVGEGDVVILSKRECIGSPPLRLPSGLNAASTCRPCLSKEFSGYAAKPWAPAQKMHTNKIQEGRERGLQ